MGFTLWDEGFLWYGVKEVVNGGIPLRDFSAYDPGRYYWSSFFVSALGDDGIMNLRFSNAILEFLAFYIALSVTCFSKNKLYIEQILLNCVIIFLWLLMPFKAIDIACCIVLIASLGLLIDQQKNYLYFLYGLQLGIVAFFGRNHGLYGLLSILMGLIWIYLNKNKKFDLKRAILLIISGLILGYSPMFFMIIFINGYYKELIGSIIFLFKIKATNLGLAIPWPRLIDISFENFASKSRDVVIGLFFTCLFIFPVFAFLRLVISKIKCRKINPFFVSSTFMSLQYLHYAISRADIWHLSLGIYPALIGALIYLNDYSRRTIFISLSILCGLSLWVTLPEHPWWSCRFNDNCKEVYVGADKMLVDPMTYSDIALLNELVSKHVEKSDNFMVTPFFPGAYPLFNKSSPIWEIYAFYPRDLEFQKTEIQGIKNKNPKFILINDIAVDWREDVKFQNTHPITYQYILDNYQEQPNQPHPNYKVFIPK